MASDRRYNALTGVFIPTFLSIIGVIMYLRLGYIVGEAGILGAILIILLAASVTIATGFSLSSIITNIRIGSGGAYAVISKTLGLEVGGSVGIPLFLAQAFSIMFYIFGFTEVWAVIFPNHHPRIVALGVLAVLFILTFISTEIAIKTQELVFVIVALSIGAIFLGGSWTGIPEVPLFGGFTNESFWALFALFFPAVTGIMAGASMSGDLDDPKRQIPRGLLSATGITILLYIVVVLWLSLSANPAQLMGDKLIIMKLARYGPLVLAGIIAATFSQALVNLVAAPRLLSSLAENSVLPLSGFFAKKSSSGTPRNATLFTGIVILSALTAGSLDALAPFLTMFFLITYAMVNVVVFIEQSLGLVSFRPTLRIPKLIPFYGAIGSIIFMFLINVYAGASALAFLLMMYIWLISRKLKPKGGDVRSGLFLAISEWAAKKVLKLPESSKHTWKPNILLPVAATRTIIGNFPLIKAIAFPNGTLTVLGMDLRRKDTSPEQGLTHTEMKKSLKEMPEIVDKFGEEGIFTSYSTVKVPDYIRGVCVSLEAIESQLFHPNILFLPFKPGQISSPSLRRVFSTAQEENVGVVLFDRDEDIGLGSEQDINVWITPKAIKGEFYEDRNFDLALLLAYRLHLNWKGAINLRMSVQQEMKTQAENYLIKLVYESRFPGNTKIFVTSQGFMRSLRKAPQGDIHIIPVKGEEDVTKLSEISKQMPKSFLFVLDSGKEDILA